MCTIMFWLFIMCYTVPPPMVYKIAWDISVIITAVVVSYNKHSHSQNNVS